MRWIRFTMLLVLSCSSNLVFAQGKEFLGQNPISYHVISGSIPAQTRIGESYSLTYQFTSNLPFSMPTPLTMLPEGSNNAFTFVDNCTGIKLPALGTCTFQINYNPTESSNNVINLVMQYGSNKISLPKLITTTSQNWVGAIGVDYNPNHYPSGNQLNFHDVFYVGTQAGQPVTNVYMELSQLQAAGFSIARSYQTIEYSWIDIINQANTLGMSVVYEANIPQNGSQTDINNAASVLSNVINAVGATTFQNTVVLVFAGHENYSNTDITYLINAVTAMKAILTNNNLTIPVGSALVSGDLVTPGSPTDMQALISSYSADAPLGFDPYPFQWGVTPPDQAANNASLQNSIAWDYAQIETQSFYTNGPRPILMAETGWATAGTGQYAGYYCYINGNTCAPSVANAATYLTALYAFVNNASNNSGVLVFEAYDEPAKDPGNPTDAENFYGLFDSNCNLKGPNNLGLLPNSSYVPGSNYGCQGFTNGALLTVIGLNPAAQTPFTVQITQTNPTTSQSASMTVTVPNQNRTNQNVNPWPQYLIFNGASVTLTGPTSGTTCTTTATVASQVITFGTVSCNNPAYQVNCSSTVCFLPTNF